MHSLAHSSTTPGRTGKHPFLPFAQKKLSWKKLKVGKRFQQVASLSLSTPRCFLHLLPGPLPFTSSCNVCQYYSTIFRPPISHSFFSFLFLEFFFLFPEGGAIWVPHASPHWAGSVPNALLVVFLRGFLSSCRPFLFLVSWIVFSVPLSKCAILVN